MLEACGCESCQAFDDMLARLLGEREHFTRAELAAYARQASASANVGRGVAAPGVEEIGQIYENSVALAGEGV